MGTRVRYHHGKSRGEPAVMGLTWILVALFLAMLGYLCQTTVSHPAVGLVVVLYVFSVLFIIAGLVKLITAGNGN